MTMKPTTSKTRAEHADKARELWAAFTPNERTGIRFGLFPAQRMTATEQEGYDGHQLAVALMAVASNNGGMRA
jgi:hypothetical protein